jgi:hypothetical protein
VCCIEQVLQVAADSTRERLQAQPALADLLAGA